MADQYSDLPPGAVSITPATPELHAAPVGQDSDAYSDLPPGAVSITTPAPGQNNPPMSPDQQAAYARGQRVPTVTDSQQPSTLTNLVTGVGKGTLETAHTVGKFLNQHLGIPMPDVVLNPKLAGGTQANNTGEAAGKFGEAIGEFVLGDEAVKGLSIAERLGMTQKVMKIATEHPLIGKAIAVGMNALRTGAVGATQALAHGATPGEAATTGTVTGLTSGALETAGEAISNLSGTQEAVDDLKKTANRYIKMSGAPQVVQDVQGYLTDAEKAMHDKFEAGLTEISKKAEGIPVKIAGSRLQSTAQEILTGDAVPADIREAMKGVVPDADKVNPLLERFANAAPDETPLNWDESVAVRQALGKTIRKLPFDSPVRPDVKRLFGAVNETMIQAAKDANKPEVSEAYNALNDAYRETSTQLEDKSIQALRNGNPDSIADVLLNKSSVHNVQNLSKLIGDDNMQDVQKSILQKVMKNSTTGGEFDADKFTRNFGKMLPEVKKALFGNQLPILESEVADVAKATKKLQLAKTAVTLGVGGAGVYSLVKGNYATAAAELLAAVGAGSTLTPGGAKIVDPVVEKGLRLAGKPGVQAIGNLVQKGVPAAIPAASEQTE